MNGMTIPGPSALSRSRLRVLRVIGIASTWGLLALLTLWATAALYIDVRVTALRVPATLAYVLGIITILLKVKRKRWAAVLCFAGFSIVLGWWLTLRPSDNDDWKPDVVRTAWAQIDGDRVTIHNFRNCDYRTETDFSNCWSDRTFHLSQIQATDFFLTNWGLRFASHPIVSFQFSNDQHIAFSIEARYKAGQGYSPILGLFRQYALIFVTADERDVIRLRTNYRKDEEVFMYRIDAPPETSRSLFLTYISYLNKLRDHPEWYNQLTRNCTTTLDKQLAANMPNQKPWNYRLILNGTLDELLYERGRLVTGGLPFRELKEREHINAAAKAADQSPDFSVLIRENRVGF